MGIQRLPLKEHPAVRLRLVADLQILPEISAKPLVIAMKK